MTVCTVDGLRLAADLIRPAEAAHQRRAALLVHGGGWSAGRRSDFESLLHGLGSAGLTAMTTDYRLSPDARHPEHVQDVKCALRWLRSHARELDIDPEKIAVIGASAGAHLAAFVAYTPDDPAYEGHGSPATGGTAVAAAVLHGCPNDLTAYPTFSAEQQATVRALLGTPTPSAAALEAASPRRFIGPGSVPTLVLHGENDTVVPRDQADGLIGTLTASAVPNRLVVIPGAGHADFGTDPDAVGRELLTFLQDTLD